MDGFSSHDVPNEAFAALELDFGAAMMEFDDGDGDAVAFRDALVTLHDALEAPPPPPPPSPAAEAAVAAPVADGVAAAAVAPEPAGVEAVSAAGAAVGASSSSSSSGSVVVHVRFRGQSLALSHAATGTTGWKTWETAYAMLRLLEKPEACARVLRCPGGALAGRRVLEVSAGTGLLAVAAAVAGAAVLATDIPAQLPLLRENAASNAGAAGALSVAALAWGEPLGGLAAPRLPSFGADALLPTAPPAAAPPAAGALPLAASAAAGAGCAVDDDDAAAAAARPFDLGLCSDALFIALRDGLLDPLLACLVDMVGAAGTVLFGYEERVMREEAAAMERLRRLVQCAEVDRADLDFCDARRGGGGGGGGGGGDDDDDGGARDGDGHVDIFYEDPPVRLFVLTPLAARSA